MKYKLTEDGKSIVMDNGKPVVVDDDGKEYPVDAIEANTKVRDAMAEAKQYRLKAKEAKDALAPFQPMIDDKIDIKEALSAIKTVESMSDEHKADINKMKQSLQANYDTAIGEKDEAITELKTKLFTATVGSKFATSEIIKRTVLPPDIAMATFGKNFSADGSAKDATGNVILSKANPGHPADFDEAVEYLINAHPNKDTIWKSDVSGGSGSQNSGDSGGNKPGLTARDNISAGLKARGIG